MLCVHVVRFIFCLIVIIIIIVCLMDIRSQLVENHAMALRLKYYTVRAQNAQCQGYTHVELTTEAENIGRIKTLTFQFGFRIHACKRT